MDFFLSINWISFLALSIVILLFFFQHWLTKKVKWTYVILISLVLGLIVGLVFASEDNAYLIWIELIGSAYIKAITVLVAPVIFISIISSFISLKDTKRMTTIGLQSIFWLLAAALAGIILALLVGQLFNIGNNAASIFADINKISEDSIAAYSERIQTFDTVLLNLIPTNVISDLADNNVVAIIIIGVALAIAYILVSEKEGEEIVLPFKQFVEATKKIIYKVLSFVINLTPYAVLCLIAGSASTLFTNLDGILQLLLLVFLIYATALMHNFVYNGLIIQFVAKLNPIRYFKKISGTMATAFTTQSSVGTLPVSIEDLTEKVGVQDDIANFTAPLGTTIGMPGCTCIWPVFLVLFYVHAVGLNWGFGDYALLIVIALLLSIGSAGVPGIALVSAISLFSVLGLPIGAVILFSPINSICDMIRTMDNVTSANAATVVVAKKQNQLDVSIFEKHTSDKKVISERKTY